MDPAFQTSFLRDFARGNSGPVLALFGKHPAWNDHMDDLGLSTPSLRTCKKLLYLQGIAANAARQQSSNAAVMPYRHSLLWFRDREALLLRLIESEDGRGRGYFPLVGAVHFGGTAWRDALQLLLPAIRSFTDSGRGLGSRTEVIDHHRHQQDQLRTVLQQPGSPGHTEPATSQETDAIRQALATGSGFARLRLPVTRYDPALAFTAIATACPGQDTPLLIAQGDSDAVTTLCVGEPDKADFWFLRDPSVA